MRNTDKIQIEQIKKNKKPVLDAGEVLNNYNKFEYDEISLEWNNLQTNINKQGNHGPRADEQPWAECVQNQAGFA